MRGSIKGCHCARKVIAVEAGNVSSAVMCLIDGQDENGQGPRIQKLGRRVVGVNVMTGRVVRASVSDDRIERNST